MRVNKEIRKHLEKHPKAIKKAKSLFRFKYPKLFLLILSIVLAYFLFKSPSVGLLISQMQEYSYIGIFIAGIFLSFGFSAPFSIGFFVSSNPSNLFLAAVVGTLGAVFSDFLIFKFIKFSFMNEIEEIKKETLDEIRKITHRNLHIKVSHYLIYLFAGILIASPLPDEFGVALLAAFTTIKVKVFLLLSFLLHFFFIFLLFFF